MKWFRSNIRHGARLALVALLVQFGLSFGHSHGIVQASPLPQTIQAADSHAIATADSAAAERKAPARPDRHQGTDEACAICAILAMAGTVLVAVPPLLLLPQAVELLFLTTDAEFLHLRSAGASFQPRAPPAS